MRWCMLPDITPPIFIFLWAKHISTSAHNDVFLWIIFDCMPCKPIFECRRLGGTRPPDHHALHVMGGEVMRQVLPECREAFELNG